MGHQGMGEEAKMAHAHLQQVAAPGGDPVSYRPLECVINEEYTVNCRREANEVYLPFSFIQKYFEVWNSTVAKISVIAEFS